MASTTSTIAILELSQSAYDEIERKLLDAGYEHLFDRGPGSRIDMSAVAVERSDDPARDFTECDDGTECQFGGIATLRVK